MNETNTSTFPSSSLPADKLESQVGQPKKKGKRRRHGRRAIKPQKWDAHIRRQISLMDPAIAGIQYSIIEDLQKTEEMAVACSAPLEDKMKPVFLFGCHHHVCSAQHGCDSCHGKDIWDFACWSNSGRQQKWNPNKRVSFGDDYHSVVPPV